MRCTSAALLVPREVSGDLAGDFAPGAVAELGQNVADVPLDHAQAEVRFVGGLIGSFIPSLWGAGQLSISSVVFFMIGGLFGIWIAHRVFVCCGHDFSPSLYVPHCSPFLLLGAPRARANSAPSPVRARRWLHTSPA